MAKTQFIQDFSVGSGARAKARWQTQTEARNAGVSDIVAKQEFCPARRDHCAVECLNVFPTKGLVVTVDQRSVLGKNPLLATSHRAA